MICWHLLTGEYPPMHGGVGHYTRLIALGLAEAGDEVHVWTPGSGEIEMAESSVRLHRLPDHFSPRSLAMMSQELREPPREARLVVQYVPQAFGYRGMNLALCLWLTRRRDVDAVMFHEVAFPVSLRQPIRHNVLAVVTRLMALMICRAAKRIFVAVPAWDEMLRSIGVRNRPISWLPVPSNIPVQNDSHAILAARRRYVPAGVNLIGHFGTYGPLISEPLGAAIVAILQREPAANILLLGDGGVGFRQRFTSIHPAFVTRIWSPGAMAAELLSHHISACDVMVQPYPDGISTRRGSAMATLAHARAVVTTIGHLTEPLWAESRAVALSPVGNTLLLAETALRVAHDVEARDLLGTRAQALYDSCFDLRHTVAALRGHADSPRGSNASFSRQMPDPPKANGPARGTCYR